MRNFGTYFTGTYVYLGLGTTRKSTYMYLGTGSTTRKSTAQKCNILLSIEIHVLEIQWHC